MSLPMGNAAATHTPESKQAQSADKQSRPGPSEPIYNRERLDKHFKARARAKARNIARQVDSQSLHPAPAGAACLLVGLPLELLAEVLLYTNPRDVLAVARTNKFLCDTLVKSSSTFIWKKAREHCVPAPLPEPTPNFTEPSYAAFLFDSGLCEVSGLFLVWPGFPR